MFHVHLDDTLKQSFLIMDCINHISFVQQMMFEGFMTVRNEFPFSSNYGTSTTASSAPCSNTQNKLGC